MLKNFGININFSPVLDNISNEGSFIYDRTFKGGKDIISDLGKSMVKGYLSAGIISCIKHFPGHNNDSLDSHEDIPVVDIEREYLNEYASQFIDVLKNSKAVLVGHILFPNIDKENPASLSSIFLGDILRKEYDFDGLIISDDMQMCAIYEKYSIEDAAVEAILAGEDILIYTGKPEEQAKAYNAVLKAVNDDVIKESVIDEKMYRILELKCNYLKLD